MSKRAVWMADVKSLLYMSLRKVISSFPGGMNCRDSLAKSMTNENIFCWS